MTRRMSALLAGAALLVAACGSDAAAPAATTAPSATAAPSATTAPAATPLDALRIYHPENLAFAAPFTVIDDSGSLDDLASEVVIDVWTTPDILRSLVTGGDSDVTAVPTYVGANLFNRGVDVKLAGVLVWGLLSVLGPEGSEPSWESLRGQTVMIPFQNDMPDLVFRLLATANGLTPGEDFEIEYYAQPPEVVSRLVSGNGEWAVLSEHVATVALAKTKAEGHPLMRVIDLQEEWAAATGTAPRFPQAGIIVSGPLADARPDVVAAVLDRLEEAVGTVNDASPETVALLSERWDIPAPVIEQVIPRLNLDLVAASEAKPELERFYTELATLSSDIIGGQLPDASFYLDDPRGSG